MTDEFEYKNHFGVIRMLADSGDRVLGLFEKDEGGRFYFEPSVHQMTCEQLTEAGKKLRELNTHRDEQ